MKDLSRLSVSGSAYGDTLQAAKALGLLLPEVLSDFSRLDGSSRPDWESRVSAERLLALWQAMEAHEAQRADYGLRIGERVSPDAKGLLASWVSQCQNLGEAMQVFARNISLMSQLERLNYAESAQQVSLEIPSDWLGIFPQAFYERSLAALITWARHLTGLELQPLRAEFVWAAPHNRAGYQRLFGPHLAFSRPQNRLVFPLSVLELPVRSANTQLQSLLAQQSQNLKAQLSQQEGVRDILAAWILPRLHTGAPGMSDAARGLGMSRATLFRRLQKEGTAYSQVLDAVRQRKLNSLSEQGASPQMLAADLGFQDVSSLNKAIRRWYGCSLSAWLKSRTAKDLRD